MRTKKLYLPLINSHTHAAMVGFRGIAEDLPLQDWLEKHIWPAEIAKLTPNFVYKNTKRAISEMKKNGIVLFSDMYFFEDEVARAAKAMGMPAIIGEVLLDFPNAGAKNFDEGLKTTEKLIKKYKDDPLIKVAVAPHSIYSVSGNNLIRAKNLAKKHKAILHIHLAETKKEFDDCQKKYGSTPTEYLDKLGVLDKNSVLVHCVWLTDKDIDIIAKRKAKVIHCPLSNLKLGSGIAPIAKMIKKGITVAIGTDGAASSNRLDIMEAGKMAALIQKGISGDPSQIPARKAIEMMTINGMKALGIEKISGRSILEIKKSLDKINDFSFLYD